MTTNNRAMTGWPSILAPWRFCLGRPRRSRGAGGPRRQVPGDAVLAIGMADTAAGWEEGQGVASVAALTQ